MKAEKSGNTEVKVTRILHLPGIPSGSGMVLADDILYIIGDDSPYLYRLDKKYTSLPPVQLFGSTQFSSGRIPKKDKPDLEALTSIEINNQTYLLAVSSGSSANREKAFLINVLKEKPEVEEYSLAGLYFYLRTKPGIAQKDQLNIEGLTTTADAVYMLQRGVGTAGNALLKINKQDFIKILFGENTKSPEVTVTQLNRPEINGVKGGFSGITCFDKKLFVTASVENTHNPVLDGEVLGSFAGFVTGNGQTRLFPVEAADGKIMAVKAESIAVLKKEGSIYKALLVTDDDKGGSELLEINIPGK